jgi:hypothetical protein
MQQFQAWPPPDWYECVVTWDSILESQEVHPRDLYEWCDRHPSEGRYHVHGWHSTEGFAFRFEDPYDAVVFKLKWRCE